MKPLRRAHVLYDFIEVTGGAERFSIELANQIQADLIVSGVNNQALLGLPELDGDLITLGQLSALPIWKSLRSMLAFGKIKPELLGAELNIFSGNNALLAIEQAPASAQNYYYCHTPPRFVYDLHQYYKELLPAYQWPVVKAFSAYVKSKYEPAIRSMDRVFCNSRNVQNRLKQYLNLDATVIYPPTRTEDFYYSPSQGYYLSTGRIEDYKRIELIVEAFLQRPELTLKIASGGSLMESLKHKTRGADNIHWLGWLSDAELKHYLAECIATIYLPKDEDFGMSPVESMAAGKPVIGVAEGGLLETIEHKQTGWLCPANPTASDLNDALEWLSATQAVELKSSCIERARKFGIADFRQRLIDEGILVKPATSASLAKRQLVDNALVGYNKPWSYPDLAQLILSSSQKSSIVTDSLAHCGAIKGCSQDMFVTYRDWRANLKSDNRKTVYVISFRDEVQLVDRVKRQLMLSHKSDVDVVPVMAGLLFEQSIYSPNVDSVKAAPESKSKLFVFCPPRSGSTLLCKLMAQTSELGSPKEHLTRPVAESVRLGAFNLSQWLGALQSNSQTANGVFSTKIISERLAWLQELLSSQQLCDLFADGHAIILKREDVAAQAVSKWIAIQSNVWHSEASNNIQQLDAIVANYKFAAIKKLHDALMTEQSSIEQFVSAHFSSEQLIHCSYEELVAEPQGVIDRIYRATLNKALPAEMRLEPRLKKADTELKNTVLSAYLADLHRSN